MAYLTFCRLGRKTCQFRPLTASSRKAEAIFQRVHKSSTIQYILNWPLPIWAFQGQWNTTKRRNRTTTTVKNPNWPEANQLAIYKCSWEVEPGTTRIKFNEWSERVLNPGSPDLKASVLTTGPHCLYSKEIVNLTWTHISFTQARSDAV